MSSTQAKTWSFLGPWRGINENNPAPDEVEDAWNVDFRDGAISRRKGRRVINSQILSKVSAAFRVAFSGVTTDDTGDITISERTYGGTRAVNDDTTTTALTLDALIVGEYYVVGLPFPFTSLVVTVGAVNTNVGSTAAVDYWDGSTWTAAGGLTDGTIAGGITHAQTGTITWNIPAPWYLWKPLTFKGQNLYWIRVRVVGVDFSPIVRVQTLRVNLATNHAQATARMDPHANGLFVWTPTAGSRKIIVAYDLAGVPLGGRDEAAYTDRFATGIARLFMYDDGGGGQLIPLPLPAAASASSNAARWSFVTFNDQLVMTNGYGPPVVYDGSKCYLLQAMQGTDAYTGVVGYVATTPVGSHMAVYNSSLYIAEGNSVSYSDSEASGLVPVGAPVGAANVWPVENFFKVGASDDPITGLAVLGAVLVIFKLNSIWHWDGEGLYPMVQDTGCCAPDSIVSLGTGLIFLASEGVFAYNGHGAIKLSKNIEPTLRKYVVRPLLSRSVAGKNHKENEYILWLPGPRGQFAVVYNYVNRTWTKRGVPWWASATLQTVNSAAASEYWCEAATSFEDPDMGDVLLTAFRGGIAIEDVGYNDEEMAAGGATVNALPTTPVIVYPRYSKEDADRDLWRYARFLTDSTGAVVTVRTAFSNSNWKALPAGDNLTLAESADSWFNTTAGSRAAIAGTDDYRSPRPQWFRLSNLGRGRYVQIIVTDTTDRIPFKIYGIELTSRENQGKEAGAQ